MRPARDLASAHDRASFPCVDVHMTLPKSFTALAWANLAAQSAEQLSLAAVPLVAVLALGAGSGEIGTLAALQTLPFLLLAIPLGLLADRISRKRLMLVAEAVRALSLLALLAMAVSGTLSLVGLGLLGFIGAIGTVGFSVAAPALVPALVPPSQFAQANGRIELARRTAYSAWPAVAGAVVAWSGAATAFVVAAMLSAGAVALLWRLAEPRRAAAAAPRHPLADIADGARFVWREPLLRPILLTGVAWNISWFVLQAAYVPYAVRALHLGAQAVGVTLGCYGAGMICGALLTSRTLRAMAFGRAIQLGPAVSVFAIATMLATLAWPTGALAGASFFLFGAGPIVWTITTTTLRQSITPNAMLGRVGSVFLAVNAGARPVGAALGAAVGAAWGDVACLWLAGAGFVLQAAIIIFAGNMNRLQHLPQPAR
jgi:predicted MFS family arabinose efflux permease